MICGLITNRMMNLLMFHVIIEQTKNQCTNLILRIKKETGELSVLSSTSDNSNASTFSNNLTSSVYTSFTRPTAPSVARSSFSRQSATSSVLSDDFSDLFSMASSSMYSTAHSKFSKQIASTAALSHDFTNLSQAASLSSN